MTENVLIINILSFVEKVYSKFIITCQLDVLF